MKKRKFWLTSCLLVILGLTLSACSSNNNKSAESLPSAQTILNDAEKTNLKTMRATWQQTNSSGKTLQKATAQYNKKPLVVYANFTTTANHYKMWISGKNNYVQMQGTSTDKWFKTKLSKTSSYAALTDSLAQSALASFNSKSLKKFKVAKTDNGYAISYKGSNKTIWNQLIQNGMITSVIGIDTDSIKPGKVNIMINTDKNYNLTKLSSTVGYKENNSTKNIAVTIDQINQLKNLKVPNKVVKSAVDLGSVSH